MSAVSANYREALTAFRSRGGVLTPTYRRILKRQAIAAATPVIAAPGETPEAAMSAEHLWAKAEVIRTNAHFNGMTVTADSNAMLNAAHCDADRLDRLATVRYATQVRKAA